MFLFREELAVMHFNENTARPQAVTAAGDGQFKVKMPKRRRGHYVVCPKKTNPTFGKHTSILKVGTLSSIMVHLTKLRNASIYICLQQCL